tara:strand:- start:66 stop:281 length:216 start_codon:yes stop_codon:yes gene_type:complete
MAITDLEMEDLETAIIEAQSVQNGDYDPIQANELWDRVIDLIHRIKIENKVKFSQIIMNEKLIFQPPTKDK